MNHALAIGNAYENPMLDEIYLEAEILSRDRFLFFFFSHCRARGGTGITESPHKSARNRLTYRMRRGRCWN